MTRSLASSWPQRARRNSLSGLAALALALPGCKSGGNAGGGDDPALAAIQARIPPLPAVELGAAPGFLTGGVVYLGLRPGKPQRWLQSLPLGPDVVRELARAGNELGFDPRVDDVAARLGVDPDAAITATLFRPLTTHAAAVRELMQRGTVVGPDPFPGASATPSDVGPSPRDFPPPRPIPPPQPISPPIPDPIYQPPPPSIVKPSPEQGDLARKAGTLGNHSHVHVPTKDAALLLAPLRRLAQKERQRPEIAGLCAQLGPSDLCLGGSSELILARSVDRAVLFDVFIFDAGTGTAADPERAAVVKEALAAPVATLAPLATLRGDFVAYVDADSFPAINEVVSLGEAVSAMRWYPESVQSRLAGASAFAALRETRRLFAGARLEVTIDNDTLQSTFQWEPRDAETKAVITRLFTRKGAAASVPTLSGLCDGSLACMRSAGLPAPATFEELAVGLYAKPEAELNRAIRDADDLAGLVLFFETWPNLIGAAQRWPREQGGRMETAMLGQVLEAVGRVEGMGGSLRSLHVNRNNVAGDFIGYMRLQGQDLTLIRSLMALAGVRFSPVTLPQVSGKVESAAIPDADVPASLLLVTDPGTVRSGDRDIEVGWAVVADSNDRLAWMLGLERSASVQPAFYLELPDLWQLIATTDEGARELNFAQGWLSGRSVRLAADVIDGHLRFDLQLARSPAAAVAK